MLPSRVLMSAYTVILVVCGSLMKDAYSTALNGNGGYQTTGSDSGGGGYSNDGGGNYAGGGSSQPVAHSTSNTGGGNSGQYNSVEFVPSAFENKAFGAGVDPHSQTGFPTGELSNALPQANYASDGHSSGFLQSDFPSGGDHSSGLPQSNFPSGGHTPNYSSNVPSKSFSAGSPLSGKGRPVTGDVHSPLDVGKGLGERVSAGFGEGLFKVNPLPSKGLPAFGEDLPKVNPLPDKRLPAFGEGLPKVNPLPGNGLPAFGEGLPKVNPLPGKDLPAFGEGLPKVNPLPGKDLPAFPSGSTNLGARKNSGVYGDGGSVVGSHSDGLLGRGRVGGGHAGGGDLHAKDLSGTVKTGFNPNPFPSGANDANLYGNTNSGAFPDTLSGKTNQLPFHASPTVAGDHGTSNVQKPSFNNVNNLASNAGGVYTDGNQAFPQPPGSHALPTKPAFPGKALPSPGNTKLSSNGAFPSPKSHPVPTVTTSNTARNDVYDSGVKTGGGTVQLSQDQVSKLGGGGNLVNELLNGNGGYGFNEADAFDVDGAFKNPNSVDSSNTFKKDFTGNVNTQVGNSKFNKGHNGLGFSVTGDNSHNQEDSIGKELDARAAAAGFSGYSDNSGGVDPRGGLANVHSNTGGLHSFPGSGSSSFRPSSDFHVNTDVRGGHSPSLGTSRSELGKLGGLGTKPNFGSTSPFNSPSRLGDRRTGSSFVGPYTNQNPLTGNVLSAQRGSNLHGGQLSSNSFGGSGLGSRAGSSLAKNLGASSKSSFTQHGGLGQPAVPGSFAGGHGSRQGLNLGNPNFSFGKQSFGSGPRNEALNLVNNQGLNKGLGSSFGSQGIKSGILGNIADSGLKSASGTVFNQNGLTSNDLHGIGRSQGFGSSSGHTGLASGSRFSAASHPQTFADKNLSGKGLSFGSSGGSGLGSVVTRSSGGRSSYSSSSSGSSFGGGSGLNTGKGAFSGSALNTGKGAFYGSGLGAGNSLTGTSFTTGGGLNKFGGTGNAVVGSSKKVYDSGLVGTSSTVTGGGSKAFSTGNGSSVSRSSSSSYNSNDLGDGGHSGSTNTNSDYAENPNQAFGVYTENGRG
ncbi:uncharacterized protein LOC143284289 isoform X2 [Babylonia areolata]|uniref:uncharacterized protein LOC143284289 isoform X2 n=1 Tax=Babylonia areolata TaxID=304850 RepID=UPI003FD62FEC